MGEKKIMKGGNQPTNKQTNNPVNKDIRKESIIITL
jgi:hypothetical protein